MEIWRDIEGYEGLYQISNKGRVKSLYKGSERILKPWDDYCGYLVVSLYKNRIKQDLKIHRLVAETFIPNLENKPQVNHKDENKYNNCVENLEWITHIDNCNYGTRNERISDSQSKPILQYSKSGDFIREWKSAAEVKRVLSINNKNINSCCKGKRKSAGDFIWRYKEKD